MNTDKNFHFFRHLDAKFIYENNGEVLPAQATNSSPEQTPKPSEMGTDAKFQEDLTKFKEELRKGEESAVGNYYKDAMIIFDEIQNLYNDNNLKPKERVKKVNKQLDEYRKLQKKASKQGIYLPNLIGGSALLESEYQAGFNDGAAQDQQLMHEIAILRTANQELTQKKEVEGQTKESLLGIAKEVDNVRVQKEMDRIEKLPTEQEKVAAYTAIIQDGFAKLEVSDANFEKATQWYEQIDHLVGRDMNHVGKLGFFTLVTSKFIAPYYFVNLEQGTDELLIKKLDKRATPEAGYPDKDPAGDLSTEKVRSFLESHKIQTMKVFGLKPDVKGNMDQLREYTAALEKEHPDKLRSFLDHPLMSLLSNPFMILFMIVGLFNEKTRNMILKGGFTLGVLEATGLGSTVYDKGKEMLSGNKDFDDFVKEQWKTLQGIDKIDPQLIAKWDMKQRFIYFHIHDKPVDYLLKAAKNPQGKEMQEIYGDKMKWYNPKKWGARAVEGILGISTTDIKAFLDTPEVKNTMEQQTNKNTPLEAALQQTNPATVPRDETKRTSDTSPAAQQNENPVAPGEKPKRAPVAGVDASDDGSLPDKTPETTPQAPAASPAPASASQQPAATEDSNKN
jgi:hypothetical protein